MVGRCRETCKKSEGGGRRVGERARESLLDEVVHDAEPNRLCDEEPGGDLRGAKNSLIQALALRICPVGGGRYESDCQ